MATIPTSRRSCVWIAILASSPISSRQQLLCEDVGSCDRRIFSIVTKNLMARNALLCVLRRTPHTPFDAELAAADWIQNVCEPGAYSSFCTCLARTSIYQLSGRCRKLAEAYLMLKSGSHAIPDEDAAAALGRSFANTLRTTRESRPPPP